jgi:hypothetical protein
MSLLPISYPPAVTALSNLDDALALPNASPIAVDFGQQLRASTVAAMDEYAVAAAAFNATERSGANAEDFTAFAAVVNAAAGVAVTNHGYSPVLEPVLPLAEHTLAFLKALSTPIAPITSVDWIIAALQHAIDTLAPTPGVSPPSTETLDQRVAQISDFVLFLGLSV